MREKSQEHLDMAQWLQNITDNLYFRKTKEILKELLIFKYKSFEICDFPLFLKEQVSDSFV